MGLPNSFNPMSPMGMPGVLGGMNPFHPMSPMSGYPMSPGLNTSPVMSSPYFNSYSTPPYGFNPALNPMMQTYYGNSFMRIGF
jgi:hypothetical protein